MSRVLTHKDLAFIKHFVAHGDQQAACRAAGLHPGGASRIMQRPQIQAAIRQRQIARMNNEALPLAVDAVLSILQDPAVNATARVGAARLVFDRVLGKEAQGPDTTKDLHEYTPEEMDAAIAKLDRAIEARGQATEDAQLIENKAEPVPDPAMLFG